MDIQNCINVTSNMPNKPFEKWDDINHLKKKQAKYTTIFSEHQVILLENIKPNCSSCKNKYI